MSLEKARMFTLGCPDLLVTVDHQSLIPILGYRSLADIPNTRLYRLNPIWTGILKRSCARGGAQLVPPIYFYFDPFPNFFYQRFGNGPIFLLSL